ncbi:DNA topoisomerase 1-like [Bombina bombina]|uniref:DNA topoisomerase 1-like n=1 Tax=Bombina bombina TaxID=8345 RepID=UPI00235A5F52|nr:DNA topoisomerase 1-like [Bombina bombina]
MLDHEYTTKDVFRNNFFMDWRKEMTLEEKMIINDLAKCDFTEMFTYYKGKMEQKKNKTKEEKLITKEENEKLIQEFGYCIMDHHKERIGNFKIEPPGLFRGRGDHPKQGLLKKRILPEDVIINCSITGLDFLLVSSSSRVPLDGLVTHMCRVLDEHHQKLTSLFRKTFAALLLHLHGSAPETGLVNKVEQDRDNLPTVHISTECMSVAASISRPSEAAGKVTEADKESDTEAHQQLQDDSPITKADLKLLVSKKDIADNFEKLWEKIDSIHSSVTSSLSEFKTELLELGNRVETLEDQKDAMVEQVDEISQDLATQQQIDDTTMITYSNHDLRETIQLNSQSRDSQTPLLNKHLQALMEGLTAKVFRTYNASITLQQQLEELTDSKESVPGKILSYNRANRAVAVLCNHQRAPPKTFDQSMANLRTKIDARNEVISLAKKELKEAIKEAKANDSEKLKKVVESKRRALQRAEEQLLKLEVQATDREENKQIALGTSKLNYLDPRISVAWCKKWQVGLEKIYNKTQRDKFAWAIDMTETDFKF